MNIIIIKDKLKEAVDIVQRVTAQNTNLPILKNILISAKDGQVTLTGTNLEIAITYSVLGKIIEPGTVTIPAASLYGLLQNLTSERITLETKDSVLRIVTDNYEAKLQTLGSEEYPLVPKIKNKNNWIEFEGSVFRDALRQTLAAAQTSEIRPELNVVLCIYASHIITLVSTDSFRLTEKIIPQAQFSVQGHEQGFSLLIPLKTAQELVHILREKEMVKLYIDENQILLESDHVQCISRRAEGNFPDYKAIIPKTFETEAIVRRDELIQALKLGSSVVNRMSEVILRVHEDKKALEVFFQEEGIGENQSFIPIKVKGPSKEASFNWRYVLDGLKELQTNDIVLGLSVDNKPAILKSITDASYFYIVMPILK